MCHIFKVYSTSSFCYLSIYFPVDRNQIISDFKRLLETWSKSPSKLQSHKNRRQKKILKKFESTDRSVCTDYLEGEQHAK